MRRLLVLAYKACIISLLSTYLYAAADVTIELETNNGSSGMQIKDSGGVVVSTISSIGEAYFKTSLGIGTTQPGEEMEVAGEIKAQGLYARDAGGLKLYDDGSNGIFIKDGGNVGIGNGNPLAQLDALGVIKSHHSMIVESNNQLIRLAAASDAVHLQSGLEEVGGSSTTFRITGMYGNPVYMTVTPDSNVGIGSTEPAQKLDVSGGIGAEGLYARDSNGLELYDDGGNGIFVEVVLKRNCISGPIFA